MKKILMSVLLCTLMITGCSDTKNDKKPENGNVQVNKTVYVSAEEAVDIYLDSADIWVEKYESFYTPNGYGYFMLDLDFDGVCELVASSNEGSGYFSYNRYYRINPESKTVEEIERHPNELDSGNDWYIGSENVKLLKNKDDNSLFYHCDDYVRYGYADYDLYIREFLVKDGEISMETVFYEHHYEKDENPEYHTHIYRMCENDVETGLEKEEYEAEMEKYYTGNVDMNLKWKTVDGFAFEEANDQERRAMLLESYTAFSYDGM